MSIPSSPGGYYGSSTCLSCRSWPVSTSLPPWLVMRRSRAISIWIWPPLSTAAYNAYHNIGQIRSGQCQNRRSHRRTDSDPGRLLQCGDHVSRRQRDIPATGYAADQETDPEQTVRWCDDVCKSYVPKEKKKAPPPNKQTDKHRHIFSLEID